MLDFSQVAAQMGAFTRGDIASACRVIKPTIAIITALKDQHIERFGSFENLVCAKYEIFEALEDKKQAFATEEVSKILKENKLLNVPINSIHTKENYEGVPFLSYAPELSTNVDLAVAVAQYLSIREDFIVDTLKKFTLPDRRKNIFEINGITVIDNSYNISPSSASLSLTSAKKQADREGKKLAVI